MAHGQADALGYNGPLQKDGISLVARFIRQDLMGQLIHAVIIPALISQPCHLGKDPLAHIRNPTVNVSHGVSFPCLLAIV